MFGMTVLTAALMRHRSAGGSFAITAAALPERRSGGLEFGENTESEAAPTLIRPWSDQNRAIACADV